MNKLFLIIIIILVSIPASAQLFIYGVQCGANYSHYSMSEKDASFQVSSGSIGFHSGFFARYDFDSFFLGADLNYTSTLGGTVKDNHNSFDIRSGSVNMPGLVGKKFYPGIRIFVGGVPTVYIKHNENEFESFMQTSPDLQPGINGELARHEFIFYILAGAGFEFSKFIMEIRYEHPLDYFFREDYSTGGVVTNIDNYHYISSLVFTVGYRFN
ncbi:MAG: outer membrane beta-barrel protein [Bacteroidales bacterium]